jgi:lysylphosphatidylglycerol synthetase-like protein (DUF2156 family)
MSQSQTTFSTPGENIPNGRGAAAILAAGIGCAAVGVLAILRDAFPSVASALNFYKPSGPLSGVTTVAVVIWLVAWFILARRWHNATVSLSKVNAAAFALLVVGLLLTFPPFMDLLQGK